ncbi:MULTISPECIES: type IV pilus modification protein PilV [unclassified Pseudomonas]|uniref:type IV pilus modification protein PilV n=1 Tax=unclassified Pseudomonas TaxID=196821 RepID=UPI002449027E|nr:MULTISPECIES: type IV pilus modification protein PilV [unclassified Pseudomonas]MDH0896115.1 type IV pilus modification protein PilV [Pseudomonas sp. GD03875]MDH1064790.1 type IV pilus modification protein PilV [Pseudomonas sp. GD03985]
MNRAHDSRGFSMIEVLVTILLICIGVLGLVALQGRTIAYTQDSAQRNVAAMLADDLQEMMRADLDKVIADGLPRASSDYYKAADEDFPDPADDCTSLADASASQRLGCWAERVKASLPTNQGEEDLMNSVFHICRTKTSGDCDDEGSTIEIQLAWAVKAGECLDGSDDSSANEYCTYSVRVEF